MWSTLNSSIKSSHMLYGIKLKSDGYVIDKEGILQQEDSPY